MYPYKTENPNTNRGKNEVFDYLAKAILMLDCAIELIKSEDVSSNPRIQKKNKRFKYQWTADISNLVELAYAILEAGCVDNGDVEIMAFVEFLGETFNIKVERCSDFYYKMRTKSGNRTAFIDKLKKKLELKMDRDDEKNCRR
ncbi:RteC domain-containing protein [Dysgonomonas sp. GY75]|uniref:RteC domain-containing protein n=1 Tax=Dysgonomonas sp. GY75 TaxID=2780419 RepID=UPI001884051C|nr:RteC domain-containing protein [Dysgonomonas sp. GY75]MBF0647216.1 RteC domain-containing protein [Dysgonomonas sp. GY75]